MANRKQVEDAIFRIEGFRVELELIDAKKGSVPEYEWAVMAPQRWKISDWKNRRLAAYRTLAKGVTVFRGDGRPVGRDMQLGNLRDSYYEAEYGPSKIAEDSLPSNVVRMSPRRKARKQR